MKNNDIWIKSFDGGEPRSIERQLCILRDRALALTTAVGVAELDHTEPVTDNQRAARLALTTAVNVAAQALRQEMLTVDVFLSGIEHGRA